jgi:diguanylate cyclase (GGDEF)-like protein
MVRQRARNAPGGPLLHPGAGGQRSSMDRGVVARGSSAPDHAREAARLITLHSLGLLDTAGEDRFDEVTRLACRFLDVPVALVSLIDADRQWFKSHQGLTAGQAEGTDRDFAFCSHAIVSDDEVFVVDDASVDPRFADNPLVTGEPDIRFYAGVPIRAPDGLPMGTLCVIDRSPRALAHHERSVLVDLAQIVERELTARFDGTTDPMTGLRNRRALENAGPLVLSLADRALTPTCVAYLDLDGLKAINDEHGHEAGDRAIEELADMLSRSFRDSDLVCRVGGDEFIALMPGTTKLQAIASLERIDALIAGANRREDRPFRLAVSIGLAERAPGCGGLADLIAEADAQLYVEKARLLAPRRSTAS